MRAVDGLLLFHLQRLLRLIVLHLAVGVVEELSPLKEILEFIEAVPEIVQLLSESVVRFLSSLLPFGGRNVEVLLLDDVFVVFRNVANAFVEDPSLF